MSRIFVLLALLSALLVPLTASAITIATVPIGNPGNVNDPNTGNSLGGVAYSYNIGEFDVTVGQYTAFLNAVAATDTYALYNSNMAVDLNVAGISQNGSSGNYTYSVIGSANHPIAYINWGDATRFANWISNGQPTGVEGPGTTETGSYTLNGATTDAALSAVTRNASATWVIPTENEWYKAAFYNPATNSYYKYPYSSSAPPTSAPPSNMPNTGNFRSNNNVFAVTGSATYSSTQNYLTDVGAYTASASPYGAFDMGGDVYQWNETLFIGAPFNTPMRGYRGGSWDLFSGDFDSTSRNESPPTGTNSQIGFRMALVPEPSTAVLAGIACGLIWMLRKKVR